MANDLAVQILSEAKRPLHYIALTYEVIRRGALLGGKTPWMTLRTSFAIDDRFVRVGGGDRTGMYALASWPPEMKRVTKDQIIAERRKAADYRALVAETRGTKNEPGLRAEKGGG